MIVIISAPSGCGKSSVAKKLAEIDKNIITSISATTRLKRPIEQEGVDYFFKTREEFNSLELLESAEIYGNLYGTPKLHIDKNLQKGKIILFDIDWQGAKQIIESKPKVKIITIFLLPPSMTELENRLKKRNRDSLETIKCRLQEAQKEISHQKYYEHIIVNDDFDTTVQKIHSLITNYTQDIK